MAEHRLYGSVRNTDVRGAWRFRGQFATGVTYAPGDVVRRESATYVCRNGHTATSFTDSAWALIADPPGGGDSGGEQGTSAYALMGAF